VGVCQATSLSVPNVNPPEEIAHSIQAENSTNFVPFCAFIRKPPQLFRKTARKVFNSLFDFGARKRLARDTADKEGLGLRNRLASPFFLEHKLVDRDRIRGVEWQLRYPWRRIEDHDECRVNKEFLNWARTRVVFRFQAFQSPELTEFESIRCVELGMEGLEAMCTTTIATKKFSGRKESRG